MKIKVLVNSFNQGKELAECVNSIINQTYQDTEICIFDRGSTDMSRIVIENLMKADKRVTIVQNPQGEQGVINFQIDAKNKLSHLNFFDMGMNHFKKYPKLGIVTGLAQVFNEKNEYLGSLGKINGTGERNPFGSSQGSEMSLVTRQKLDVAGTFLPKDSSLVKDTSGDILFIHQTVIKINDDPKKIEPVFLTQESVFETKPFRVEGKDEGWIKNEILKESDIKVKKPRGRPRGSKNKIEPVTI